MGTSSAGENVDAPLFGLDNLPYGIFSVGDGGRRVGARLGDAVLDLSATVPGPSLNALMAAGPGVWRKTRAQVIDGAVTGRFPSIGLDQVTMHLPFEVADYADFYSSEYHAVNVSRILRPGQPALLPNWRHMPIGYHGRAGTVVVSGTRIERPSGQLAEGIFGPSARLDIEAEVGFVVGVPGRRIAPADFAQHVFGVVLVNDWSARDIQAWEYRPLGPFLGKSFATSVSAWVTPLDALSAAWTPAPAQDPEPHSYLLPAMAGLDLRLSIHCNGTEVSAPPFASMYWTPAQQLAHLTVNGAGVRTGDLFASGTVSGARRSEAGSLLELTSAGAAPVTLDDGSRRAFLHDGDTVTISGIAAGPSGRMIGLGPVTGTIAPA